MTHNTTLEPNKYFTLKRPEGYRVYELLNWPLEPRHRVHSTYPTREEAEAVALALNALSK